VESLKADSGIDPELFQTGMLIGLDEQSPAVLAWLKTYQQAHVWLTPQDLATSFSQFNFHSSEVLALPDLANIRNPRLLKALLGALKRLPSVKIFEQCPVVQFFSEAGAVKGVQLASGERVFALKVVLTAGAWSGDLSPQASPIDVKPVKGQMILFAPSPFVSTMLLEEERYFIPRKDGRVLVGSSVEHVGFDKQTDALMRDALIDFAVSRCPALANVPVETHWAGLRPGSPEGVPYIGQSQTVSGLFYNTGHFRNGLVLQPASVERLLASMGYSVRF
jgi:glycine oxidase